MYFYHFSTLHHNNIYQSHHKSKPGDLIFYNNSYYLNLWETIARPEQGATSIHFDQETMIKWLCTTQTIELLHRMVNERFSSYNKCIPLFFWNDITLLIKHKKSIVANKKSEDPQSLLIFPSIFSLTQYRTTHTENNTIILNGQSTDIAKAKAYRSISNGETTTILSTHSQLFQNRNNLTTITVIDPYSPQYQTYHDPRYNVSTIIEKMKDILEI